MGVKSGTWTPWPFADPKKKTTRESGSTAGTMARSEGAGPAAFLNTKWLVVDNSSSTKEVKSRVRAFSDIVRQLLCSLGVLFGLVEIFPSFVFFLF